MSASGKLRNALMLVGILKSRKLMTTDFPINNNFSAKATVVHCRGCKGTGTKPDSADNCPQCGGRGVEKLSKKALERAARNGQFNKEADHGK